MVNMYTFNSRGEWLEARKSYIGGSDAATVLGMNPYKNNVDLWKEKTGRKQGEDISDKPYVKYGTEAEEHLRALFALDFPQYEVNYLDDNMFLNEQFPWAHASLDGWLTDSKGRKGILEIKTTEIMRAGQKDLWKGRIPDNYFIQLLHYFMVTEFDFAILKAQIKYDIKGDVFLQTKHYNIEREEVESDIAYLKNAEEKFWEYIKTDKQPNLILPAI